MALDVADLTLFSQLLTQFATNGRKAGHSDDTASIDSFSSSRQMTWSMPKPRSCRVRGGRGGDVKRGEGDYAE